MGEKTVKILQLASGDTWGGAERVISLLAANLIRKPNVEVKALLLAEGRLAETLRTCGISVEVVPEAKLSFLALRSAVRRKLANERFDVVHAHRYKEALLATLARPARPFRLVVTLHGVEPWKQIGLGRALRIWAPMRAAHLSGAWLVGVSRDLQRRMERTLGSRRVVRVPNPMACNAESCEELSSLRQRFDWPEAHGVVVFAGRLERTKGPDHLLEVARRTRVDAGFLVLGSGSLDQALRERIRQSGLGHKVRLLGEVPDVRPYLKQADVLALPSRHEGLPMVVLEAANQGLPVVGFAVGGVPEVLDGGPAARLIPADDLDAFAAAVDDLLARPAEARSAASLWGASLRARFDIEIVTSAYLSVYRGENPELERAGPASP